MKFKSFTDLIERIRNNPAEGLPYLQIVDKSKKTILFTLNAPQKIFIDKWTMFRRNKTLKARQEGISTLIQALYFLNTVFVPNTNTVIVSHNRESTQRMLARSRLFYEKLFEVLPWNYIPSLDEGYKNKNELYFPTINSRLFIGTAGSDAFGRGDTINNLHLSEHSSYKGKNVEDLLAGLVEAVPLNGRIDIESTPRGIGNIFYNEWSDPYSVYQKILLPWFIHDEYKLSLEEFNGQVKNPNIKYPTIDNLDKEEIELIQSVSREWNMILTFEQLAFRRYKVADRKRLFPQEYIENDIDCFLVAQSDVFDTDRLKHLLRVIDFKPSEILEDGHLTIWKDAEDGHDYNIGVDCSEGDINSDFGCATVLDVQTNEEVACLHGRFKDFVFADKLCKLGWLYNTAQLAIERNNHGHSVINSCVNQFGYTNMYIHDDEKLGWLTSGPSKAIMLTGKEGLVESTENGEFKVRDKEYLRECFTFEYKGSKTNGSMGASDGSHDDRIMSKAITWATRVKAMIARNSRGEKLMVG